MTANTNDDPAIAVYLDDALDTLWALDLIGEWLDYASADTHDDLNEFCQSCGQHQTVDNLQNTIIRQAAVIRRQLATLNHQGAAIN